MAPQTHAQSSKMTTPQTPKHDPKEHRVTSSPPTSMATRRLQDYIFEIKEDLPSGEYKEMLENCGKLYDLEMSHEDFARRLSCLSNTHSTPIHISKQLQHIHILNQHIMQARKCAMKFKLLLEYCRSKKNMPWNTKVNFQNKENTMKSIFKAFVRKYKFHQREANILSLNVDSQIINQLQYLNENLYYLNRNLSK